MLFDSFVFPWYCRTCRAEQGQIKMILSNDYFRPSPATIGCLQINRKTDKRLSSKNTAEFQEHCCVQPSVSSNSILIHETKS